MHKSWSLSSAEPWQVFHTSGIRAKYIDQPKNALISLKIYAGSFIIHEISNTHNSKLRMHHVVFFRILEVNKKKECLVKSAGTERNKGCQGRERSETILNCPEIKNRLII